MTRPVLKKKAESARPALKPKTPASPVVSKLSREARAVPAEERSVPWRQLLASVSGKQIPGEKLILEAHNTEGDMRVRMVRSKVEGKEIITLEFFDAQSNRRAVAAIPFRIAKSRILAGLD